MASIQKRGKKFAVIYSYEDQNGTKRQKWETFQTKKDAYARKVQVEAEQLAGTFISPSTITVREFLKEFVEVYGSKRWGLSTYSQNMRLIDNYINPTIGDVCIQDISKRTVDNYILQLQKTAPVTVPYRHAKTEFLPAATIEKIIKLLSCAFHQAVRWDMIGKNPFQEAILPKRQKRKRDIWTAETIRKALDSCRDARLYIAINLAFACSLRLGEITGLTWDCVHISDQEIAGDNASLEVNKELARVSMNAVEAVGRGDILFEFPRVMDGRTTTRLVLKKPKTESSIRRVWIPRTLARILRDWREKQQALKDLLGSDYADYNLVLALDNGRPVEDRVLGNAFDRLKKEAGLPDVVFHSLRHSSTTYKLKLSHGNIKATQGDTGHSQSDMVTDLYAHILDEDRKLNAQRFEAAFYANPDMRQTEAEIRGSAQSQQSDIDIQKLFAQLQQNPEVLAQLAALLKNA